MDSLFDDAGADSGDAETGPASVEAIVAAFRDASGRAEASPSRPAASVGPSGDENSFSDEPGAEGPDSPVDILRGTLAAFRKTRRQAEDGAQDARNEEREASEVVEAKSPSSSPADPVEDDEGPTADEEETDETNR